MGKYAKQETTNARRVKFTPNQISEGSYSTTGEMKARASNAPPCLRHELEQHHSTVGAANKPAHVIPAKISTSDTRMSGHSMCGRGPVAFAPDPIIENIACMTLLGRGINIWPAKGSLSPTQENRPKPAKIRTPSSD